MPESSPGCGDPVPLSILMIESLFLILLAFIDSSIKEGFIKVGSAEPSGVSTLLKVE